MLLPRRVYIYALECIRGTRVTFSTAFDLTLLLTGDPWPFDYEVSLVCAKVGHDKRAVDHVRTEWNCASPFWRHCSFLRVLGTGGLM